MTRDDYEKQLRKIVLHSADIIPEKVAEYLQEVAKYGYTDTKKEILKEYKPLVDHIPKAFVDFALDIFIKKPRMRRLPPPVTSDNFEEAENSNLIKNLPSYLFEEIVTSHDYEPLDFGKLGIEDFMGFLPPSHVQGSFLYLLQKNEDEGLRLVQTLTNFAVSEWRKREQKARTDESSRTPLPVIIDLSSQAHEFWGNADIYCWYRGTSVGPYPVISALMALEVWMERQIEAGRNVEELFHKVLLGSDCVAVLGICVTLALAYPEKCLKAILPIVSAPAIWRMDIYRLAHEDDNPSRFPWEQDKLIYRLIDERNQKPHRKVDIRALAMQYMLSGDDSLCIPFQEAVAKFTDKLPFRYKQEEENLEIIAALREQMENYQAFGNLDNYFWVQHGNQWLVQVEAPQAIRERNQEQLAANLEWQRWFSLSMWAQKTIKIGQAEERMTLEEAVAAAKGFQKTDDFSVKYESDQPDANRLRAIVGVAAAILVADFEWTKAQGLITWSRGILLAAARLPYQGYVYNRFPADPKVSAGRGLGILVTHSSADQDVREVILKLISDPQQQVVQAAFRGIYEAWMVDEVLCWNALNLGISLCLEPINIAFGSPGSDFGTSFAEKEKWQLNLLQTSLDNLSKNTLPIIRVPSRKDAVFLHDLAQNVLHALPFPELLKKPTSKQNILQVTDDLMAWTIEENTPNENDSDCSSQITFEWNRFFLRWVSCLAQSLNFEEIHNHLLTPLQNCWSKAPNLTTNLLSGFIDYHIGYVEPLTRKAQLGWKEICNWVLDSPEVKKEANNYFLSNEISDALSRIVFVEHGKCWFEEQWSHAALFSDIIEKWVKVIGHNPQAFSYLITMLSSSVWQFAPEPTLGWLTQCVNASTHPLWQERDNGERTAELLQRIWNNFEKQIRERTATLQHYSDLVYRLVDAGVPLAGLLRQKLEQRSK
ncbi:hypothetical protein A4S05_24365 [Nostoc sp. KVJ20]|uniref:hypothetical protein n=1 Tax=Nostoc sp. KVJ20 TaxID=457944 RepID=UPI00083DB329|nr:hypothetical protein [Nostoc sp. KVJ20]ODH02407.1 hypothetical protein A4S05_24365 [Nostoc sp. KVJ20]